MAVFKSLTFDGINSLDYGIYITGEAVYNAPERAVEMVTIPGRNGALAIDQGYFENIEVSYPCGCFADTQADFAEKVSAFRNAIGSRYSYKRLTDEYNADEYRLGLYKSGLEVSAVRYGTAGQFTITFDCKPQRFLLDGDTELEPTDYRDLKTKSGSIVQITNDGTLGVKSVLTTIEPIQDLHGYDKPWSGGNGKNKLLVTATSGTVNGVTLTVNEDGTVKANGTASNSVWFKLADVTLNGSYIINGSPSGGGSSVYALTVGGAYDYGSGASVTLDGTSKAVYLFINNGQTVSNLVFKPMIRLATETDATFAPYSNICPISGHTECVTYVSPTTSATDAEVYTTNLGRTVYGGTLDVVSGVLTVTDANIASYNGETLPSTWISDRDVYSSGTTPTTGAQVVYKLSSPQTYQLTPTEVELLLGTNNLWTSTGAVTVKYGVYPYYNPTEFDARPLIKITGSGNVAIGSQLISVTDIPNTTTVYIDCDTMEIYTLSGGIPSGASSHVSFNGNDFPVLPSGLSNVTHTTRGVSIAPRWWRI